MDVHLKRRHFKRRNTSVEEVQSKRDRIKDSTWWFKCDAYFYIQKWSNKLESNGDRIFRAKIRVPCVTRHRRVALNYPRATAVPTQWQRNEHSMCARYSVFESDVLGALRARKRSFVMPTRRATVAVESSSRVRRGRSGAVSAGKHAGVTFPTPFMPSEFVRLSSGRLT